MACRNAKNLILLSRSGIRTREAQDSVEHLTALGVKVATPRCDIVEQHSLDAIMKECMESMPPIKGCIQSAVHLEV